MSNNSLHLKIATPERVILEETVDQVSVPTETGEITILPHHVPLIAPIVSGDIVALKNGEPIPMAVVGGFVQVKPNEVIILADFAEHVSEMSEAEIIAAKERAEQAMADKDKLSKGDFEHFAAELERSLTRERVQNKWRGKKYKKINI